MCSIRDEQQAKQEADGTDFVVHGALQLIYLHEFSGSGAHSQLRGLKCSLPNCACATDAKNATVTGRRTRERSSLALCIQSSCGNLTIPSLTSVPYRSALISVVGAMTSCPG